MMRVFLQSILLSGLFLLMNAGNLAQAQQITGKVTDDTGAPLSGASVLVEGTQTGALTNDGGMYKLTLPSGAEKLVFSFLGFGRQTVDINGRTTIDVTLLPQDAQVDEVIITALGIERDKKALGYAAQEVAGAELLEARETNIVNSLAGKVAGVQITNGNSGAGSTSRIVIRGESSLTNNNPLFVVDGVPISNNTDLRTSAAGIASNMPLDYGNDAAEVDPNNIESITVLKGANATALYGSRAANGVVLITTKSGRGKKGIGVSLNSSITFENVMASPQYQTEFGQGKNGRFEFVDGYGSGTFDGVDESWGPALDGRLIKQFDSPTANGLRGGDVHGLDYVLGSSGVNLDRRGEITPTPWISHGDPVDQFFTTGNTLSNNLSFSGANENGSFRLSYTNFRNKGMAPNTDLFRDQVGFNGGFKLGDKVDINIVANYINTKSNNRHVNNYGTESVMYLFTWLGMQLDLSALENYWQDGLEGFQQYNYNYNYHDNPYFTMYENTNALDKNRTFGNISATWHVTPHLNLMVRGGNDFYNELRTIKRAFSTQRFPRGQYREDKINFRETNLDLLLSYRRDFGDLGISLSGGGNRMIQTNHFHGVTNNQLIIPGIFTFSNTDIPLVQAISRPEKQINSVYAFGQISYKNQYFLDITGRNDWASSLVNPYNPDISKNSYFYPSVSASAILSDIFKVSATSPLSFAKLRLGWAQAGNDTQPFAFDYPYVFSTTTWGSNAIIAPSNTLPPTVLDNELQTSLEVGTDIRFFQNRVNLDLTFYNTNTTNQILAIDLPPTSGATSRLINAGNIRNRGIEALLTLVPVKRDNGFQWNTSFNFTLNRNKVIDLGGVEEYVLGGDRVTLIARPGGSLGDMYGTGLRKVEDVNSEYYGQVIFKNGLVQQDQNLRLLGNYNPDFMLGWNNRLSFKNLYMSFLFDWRQGGELLSTVRLIAATSGNVVETLWGRSPNYAGPQPGIKDGYLPRTDAAGNNYQDGVIGDGVKEVVDADGNVTGYVPNDVVVSADAYHNNRYRRQNETEGMYDASFIKLRELRFGYSLPASVLSKTPLTSVKVALVGRNLLLFFPQKLFGYESDLPWYNHGDPELLSTNGSQFVPGVENMALPSARSLGINLTIEF
ncbi:MAG: SusC/RagA family TonB-linked outer membrane protein [Bacteroidia bacterium]